MSFPILVTGACGFVGRHLVKRLLKDNNELLIVDDLSTGTDPQTWIQSEYQSKYNFIKKDVRDFLITDANKLKFSDVYHLSAVVGGRIKIDKDPIAVARDLSIDAEFFNWAVKNKPERILYASSSAAYPIDLQKEGKEIMLKEEMITFEGSLGSPDMTYGWSKLTGEYLSRLAAKFYNLNIACVRPFSGYGEDQDLSYPIPAIGLRAVKKEDPLIIWGTGKQTRDFVYIEDCIDAILKAIENISDGSAVNISSGQPTSFLEVAKIYSEIAGYAPTIKPLVDMPEGVFSRFGDTTKAESILNWTPKTNLKNGLTIVFNYLQQNLSNISDNK